MQKAAVKHRQAEQKIGNPKQIRISGSRENRKLRRGKSPRSRRIILAIGARNPSRILIGWALSAGKAGTIKITIKIKIKIKKGNRSLDGEGKNEFY